jgi:uncharacterized protein YjbI with pentapeptide repeats
MKYVIASLLALFTLSLMIPSGFGEDVPDWVKNTAGWWATDAISESEFVNAIEYLVKENIIQVNVSETSGTSQGVPDWIKNNAGWWADGQIDDQTFVNGIEFLIKEGIIQVTSLTQEINSCEFEHIPVLNNLNPQQKIDVCKSAQIDYLSERLDCSPCTPEIKYNSYGFRGPEISKEKPDNTIRIFLVGGSTMANTEYADELFTTKGQMQQKIDELNLDVEVEIINAAIASAKSWHELQLAEDMLYDFNPDMIIHYTGWNDITAQVRDYEWISVDKDQAAPEVWTQRTKENNANSWFENFRDACETREKMGIKTIVVLNPFVGTGKKVMTDQELDFFVEFGNGRNLELYPAYVQKVEELSEHCFAAANLSEIFDNFAEPIYRDGGHTLKKGMKVVADHLLYLALPAISSDVDPNEILKPYKQNQNQANLSEIQIDDELKYIGASLANSDFSNQNLRGMNFFGSDLRNSDFSNSDVTNANFELADLTGADFEGAKVDQIKLKRAKLLDVNFSGVKFNSDLNHVDFRGSNLSNADLTKQDLKNTILSNVNMKGANLTGAVLSYEDIGRYNFLDNSDVRFTDFTGASLVGIDFTKVKNKDLTGANFKSASLAHATLNDVNLAGNDFTWANLKAADFSNQDFTNNITIIGTIFFEADLSNASFEGVDLSHKIKIILLRGLLPIGCEDSELKQKVFGETRALKLFIISCEVVGNELHIEYAYFNNFSHANLENVNFKNADLRNTYLGYADLSNANLSGANLGGAILDYTILTDANLSGANLEGARLVYDETTILNCINHSICLDR